MITAAAREYLADQLRPVLGADAVILPYGVAGPFQPPAVVFGQPDVEFDEWGASHKVLFGMAVVVRQHPEGPSATQRELEGLWPRVARALLDITREDRTLGGHVDHAAVKQSQFGDLLVQGTPFPAQNIILEIFVS